MKVKIVRILETASQTFGNLYVYDGFKRIYECKTLELPWRSNQRNISCIPVGKYKTDKHSTPAQGKCFSLKAVPGREGILIHKGNYVGSLNPWTRKPDTSGCIIVGKDFLDIDKDGLTDVTGSEDALSELLGTLPDNFVLDIHG
jgi:hypothetical protein